MKTVFFFKNKTFPKRMLFKNHIKNYLVNCLIFTITFIKH